VAIVTGYWEDAGDQAGTYDIQLVEGDVVRGDAEGTWKSCAVEETSHAGWLPHAAPVCEEDSTIVGFGVN